ncbi:MAG: tetraacyldisaccharide 4'-kinase, partial [Candidatus Hydrogenedentes bacterium]|nr:tetraacyldisaccharide 4'-kinase [Candidatus Hydrogenedentota bacterium]
AHAAIEKGCDVLLMDDGFQAVALARDENILLIDATNPFGNGYLVPRGILRETLHAMKRATEIILTRCDQAPENLEDIHQTLQQYAPEIPIRQTQHKPLSLLRVCDGSEVPLSLLQDTSIRVICGIGNPDAFMHTLEKLGTDIVESHSLPDHGSIPHELLHASIPVVMTEKDAIRISSSCSSEVYALTIALESYG